MLPHRSDSGATRRNEMDAVSTCTRFCARHSNSGCMPFAELLRVSERISRDCSSLECAGKTRTCDSVLTLLSLLSYRTPRTDYWISTQIHLDSINRLSSPSRIHWCSENIHLTTDTTFLKCSSAFTYPPPIFCLQGLCRDGLFNVNHTHTNTG